jgi:hypothetical protein
MSDSPGLLEYRPPDPKVAWRPPRWVRRVVWGTLAFILFLAFGVPLLSRLVDRFVVLSAQHKCMSHQFPTGALIYASGPGKRVEVRCPPWDAFWPNGSGPVAFVHRRVSPGGHERLIAIEVGGTVPSWGIADAATGRRYDVFSIAAQVHRPGGLFNAAENLNVASPQAMRPVYVGVYYVHLEVLLDLANTVSVFAGQPDPNDASRFTVELQFNDTPVTIDGQLLDDETVVLTPRAGRVTGQVVWEPPGLINPAPANLPANVVGPMPRPN